ncbi:MAG TPA: non-ribosomal peptide synthetase [Tepidisphaeraceae bacterium]|jgi:amino acid adenylation domain-containing protein|nr:non-ribosomal peptide synthetase [Tepidisphaeraceae bacterium]
MQSSLVQLQPATHEKAFSESAPAGSICERIALRAITDPGRSALIDGSMRLSFAELEDRSNQLAALLRDAGAESEQCVGLLLDRSADFVVAALAVLKTGAAYLPLDPATPADRAAFILADAGAKILLTHRRAVLQSLPADLRVIELDASASASIATSPATFDAVVPDPSCLACVIYTSGSTGQPKGVEITHGNLLNLIDWHCDAFDVTASDKASQVAGVGFDAAGWEIWPHLTAGASVHIADEMTRRSPQTLRDWLVAEGITIAFVPTVLAEQLLHSTWPKETRLRRLLTGADTLHRRPSAGLPFVLVNNYGPTECTVVSTSGTVVPDAAADGPPSIGRAIANAVALILDESLRPTPAGEAGELCMAGALVGRGYRNRPELTASKFVAYFPASGPSMRIYRTGDRARLLPSGEIAFLGRLDDQVKIRGYRIELGEIISLLDRYPGIEASAVIVRNDVEADAALVAYVVGARDSRLIAGDIRAFLAARVPDYMVPSRFVALSELPMTANGKLDKTALPAPDADNLLPGATPVVAAPAMIEGPDSKLAVESKIAAVVASLLGQPSVRRDDNFFMIGGHSMLGVQLVARIRDAFGVKLTLRQLFTAPTVAALSAEVARLTEQLLSK